MKKKLDKKMGVVVSWLYLPDGWICSGVSGGGTLFLRLASAMLHQVPMITYDQHYRHTGNSCFLSLNYSRSSL